MSIDADTIATRQTFARLADVCRWDDARLYGREPSVSAWSPAQHVDHLMRSAGSMLSLISAMAAGREHERIGDKGSPSLGGRAILLSGKIPRGRAEAPDFAVPEDEPDPPALAEAVRDTRRRFESLAERAEHLPSIAGVGQHPLLGWFKAQQWWRFLRVHGEHHLALIDDIDKARRKHG